MDLVYFFSKQAECRKTSCNVGVCTCPNVFLQLNRWRIRVHGWRRGEKPKMGRQGMVGGEYMGFSQNTKEERSGEQVSMWKMVLNKLLDVTKGVMKIKYFHNTKFYSIFGVKNGSCALNTKCYFLKSKTQTSCKYYTLQLSELAS